VNFHYKFQVTLDSLNEVNGDAELLKRVITSDETWIYRYDIKTKTQSFQWKHSGSLRLKKAHQVWSNVKVILTVFFDFNGLVHHEFLPRGQTVNKKYNLQVQRCLR